MGGVPIMARRNTLQSIANGGLPEILLTTEGQPDSPLVSRKYFEHAEEEMMDDEQGRGSIAAVARRGTGRRSQAPPNRSRDSSPCSRSTSPANSVDAFADPRARGRANTVGSKCPSDLDIGIQRTISGGTHCCRPPFGDGSVCQKDIEVVSYHNVEDDVCFPQTEESYKTFKIDFEELDEFVAQSTRGKPQIARNRRQKLSFSSQGNRPNIDRSASSVRGPVAPELLAQSTNSIHLGSDCAIDRDSILDEKNDDPLCANGPRERIPVEPHRYSFFSSEIEQTIHAADFADLLSPGQTSRDLFELPPDSGVWWMNVLNPTELELNIFKAAFDIHRLTTEDIITQEMREKVELFKQYYFVCFRSFGMDKTSDKYMEPVNVYMVVFRQGILTFTYTQSPHAANVRKRIGKLRDYMLLGADWICYAMIDDIVDTFIPVIDTIQVETDQIEDQVFIIRTDDFTPLLRLIGDCRKRVMSLMRLLGGKADVIKGFAKRCTQQSSVTPRPEIGLYLGDIQDHVVTNMNNLSHFEKMLSRSHSNCLAQISVDAIAQGNRANEVLSKITLLASILVPMNLVCGLFGMNVPVPGRETDGFGWFFGIVGFISILVSLCLYIARRYRFI